MRTQVGIVGAGPAGLMLSHLLHLAGIESVVLENRSRDYIESRIRAGLIEHWAADLLVETGVGERMQREGLAHDGIYFCFNDELHYIDFDALVGKGVTIYGQQEVVKDLIARRLADGGQILFDVDDVSVEELDRRAENPFPARRQGARTRLRFHRRLRRLPRRLPAEHSGRRRSPTTTANIRSAGSASWRRRPPAVGRADLLLSRARLCAVHHALADAGAALRPVRAGRGPRATGRMNASGRNCMRVSVPARRGARRGAGSAKGRHRDAQLRGRADAIRPAVPRRRFRPHRAADRRQGHEPRDRRRADAVARTRGVLPRRRRRAAASAIRRPVCGGCGRRSASPGG